MASDPTARVSELLHEVAETHHVVYRITDGDDPDWASFYADWLLDHSELPALLGEPPVRSHLVHALVQLDRDFVEGGVAGRWEDWYAGRLVDRFGPTA
jgi:hypothetical protein